MPLISWGEKSVAEKVFPEDFSWSVIIIRGAVYLKREKEIDSPLIMTVAVKNPSMMFLTKKTV